VFAAAARGDERAAAVVAEEAELVARVLCAIVTVVDPELIVLGGGIGQAPGFAAAVTEHLHRISPVEPVVRVSALGTDAVVDGALAAATDLAWTRLAGNLPAPASTPAPADEAAHFPSPDGDGDGAAPALARTRARRNSTPAAAADGASSGQADPAGRVP
jgi:predicted NBD/HSP70 family sugar kinase